MVVQSFVGYCQCGNEIWIEYLFDGNEWFQRFFDQELREITRCPVCSTILLEDELASFEPCAR